ncbi:MAG: hypothetical protein LUC48_09485 [Clostridiales bacterium]|nr:hypothetical protein [Clostridiales bacterium]
MRFDNVSSDIQKFRDRDDLTLNELLGMFQNLELDVKKAQQKIETSPVGDSDELTSKLIWLCNLPVKIEKNNAQALSAESRYRRLQERTQALQQKVSAYEQEQGKLEQEAAAAAELEAEVAELRAELQRLQTRRQDAERLQTERQALTAQLDSLRQLDLEGLRAENRALEESVQELQTTREQLTGQRQALDSARAASQADIAALQSEIQTLAEGNAALAAETQKLRQHQDALEGQQAELAALQTSLAEVEQTYQETCTAIDHFTCQKEAQAALLAEKAPLAEQLKNEKETLQTRTQELVAEIASLEHGNPALEQKNRQYGDRADTLRQENDALRQMEADLRAQVDVQEAERVRLESAVLPELNAQLELHTQDVEESRKKQAELQEGIACKLRESEAERQALAEAEAAYRKADDALDAVKTKKESMLRSIQAVDNKTRQMTAEVEALNASLEQKNEDKIQATLAQQQADLQRRIKDCEQMNQEISRLQRENEAQEQQRALLAERQAEAQARQQKAVEDYQQLELEFQGMTQKETELASLQTRLSAMNVIVKRLEEDSRFFDRKPFSLAKGLQDEMNQAERTLSEARQAIKSYQEKVSSH